MSQTSKFRHRNSLIRAVPLTTDSQKKTQLVRNWLQAIAGKPGGTPFSCAPYVPANLQHVIQKPDEFFKFFILFDDFFFFFLTKLRINSFPLTYISEYISKLWNGYENFHSNFHSSREKEKEKKNFGKKKQKRKQRSPLR